MRIVVKLDRGYGGDEEKLFSIHNPRIGEWDDEPGTWVYDPHDKAAPDDVKRARAVLLQWLEQLESDDATDALAAAKLGGSA
jgi:hypothetical protein